MDSTILDRINDLNQMIVSGRILEAFDKYYHDQVVMQENELEPMIGKSINRLREEIFLNSIIEFRSATPVKVAVGNGLSMVEWYYDYTHKDWGIRKYTQVSVQQWKDGKIIFEKFYYNI